MKLPLHQPQRSLVALSLWAAILVASFVLLRFWFGNIGIFVAVVIGLAGAIWVAVVAPATKPPAPASDAPTTPVLMRPRRTKQ